jgi:hypothetical protein
MGYTAEEAPELWAKTIHLLLSAKSTKGYRISQRKLAGLLKIDDIATISGQDQFSEAVIIATQACRDRGVLTVYDGSRYHYFMLKVAFKKWRHVTGHKLEKIDFMMGFLSNDS